MSSIGTRLTLAALAGAGLIAAGTAGVSAQAMNNVGPRMNINVGPRININPGIGGPRMPDIRYSPDRNYQVQSKPDDDQPRRKPKPVIIVNNPPPGGNEPPPSPPPSKNAAKKGPVGAGLNNNFVRNEVLIEVDGILSDAQADALSRRHRLARLESQAFELTGTTLFRWRIPDGRSADAVRRQLAGDGSVRATYLNMRFALQQSPAPRTGDPAQYVVPKLKLTEALSMANGTGVLVAVIDSGIDVNHPELAGAVVGSFDALKSNEKPHVHGTGIAGAIAAHSRLIGTAPNAQILAIRAFGMSGGTADSTTFNILKGLEFAAQNRARVINMSFAGPTDPLLEKALAALAARNVVLIAAAGNAGPKSPPLFPGADKNVIAVSATDANDQIFSASNRGKQVAIAAPGVDVLVPAPDGKYQITSGTSFSAAYVSGLAALVINRKPDISAAEVRSILTATARDLGPRGRDDDYGAGLADAFAAVTAVEGSTAPVAVSSGNATR
jgi:subtilisin family serine protease